MNLKRFALSTGAMAVALTASTIVGLAQGPMYDKVIVNLPYTVTVSDKTLQPGQYTIRELPSTSKSYVLLIYSDNGMRFETSAMTIPTLDNQTPNDTSVVLHHFGPDYYFDKVWIQGKNYGYEFPLPNSIKQRQREEMQPVSVAATYQSAPAETTTTAQNTQTQTQTQAETTPAPAPAPEATPAPAPAPAPAETAQNNNTAQTDNDNNNNTNNNTATDNTASNNTASDNTANREMPNTDAGWLMMLLSGGALSGAGLMLRKRR
jgi:LPXTG-motif cell wall-anchored protein